MRRTDLAASAAGAFVFSFALGLASVAMPLLALQAGYSKPAIGYLTALSAVSQMGCRLVLGAIMRTFSDWAIVLGAAGLLAASCLVVAVSPALVPFALAELLQGAARGCFWTGSQTHVVRGPGSSVRRLATVNLISSIGQLAGPLAAGAIGARSFAGHPFGLALLAAGVAAALGMVPPVLLDRLPPFAKPQGGRNAVWRLPGVMVGNLAGITAGTWRAVMNSYVAVALVHAGRTPGEIGVLVSVANGAALGGSALLTRIGHRRLRLTFALSTLATGLATAAVAAIATSTWAEAGVLAVSGVGAGVLQALGPAIAADAVAPEQRGDAIAVAGTYRAAALFGAPLAIGASLAAIPLTAAVLVTGAVIALPAALVSWVGARRPAVAEPPASYARD